MKIININNKLFHILLSHRILCPILDPSQLRIMLIHKRLARVVDHQRRHRRTPPHRRIHRWFPNNLRRIRINNNMPLDHRMIISTATDTTLHIANNINGKIVSDNGANSCGVDDLWDLDSELEVTLTTGRDWWGGICREISFPVPGSTTVGFHEEVLVEVDGNCF